MKDSIQKALQVVESTTKLWKENLGDLPERLLPLLHPDRDRSQDRHGRMMQIVSEWCAQHPTEAARIVGSVALARATQLGMERDPELGGAGRG